MSRTHCMIYLIGFFLAVMSSGCARHTDLAALHQKYANAASKTLEINGMPVHYRDEGHGPVLVLLHGTGSSLHTWDAWVEQLADHFRVIRMDLPGSGLTGPHPQRRYEIPDDVAFLTAFMDQLEITRFHLAGNSLGGRIAWEFARQHPQRLQSLTLINALGYPQDSWPPAIQLGQVPFIDNLMATYIPRFVFAVSLSDIYHPDFPIDDALIDRYYELALREGNLQAFTDRVKARLDQDSHLIAEITVPTLILWGENDRFFPVSSAHRFHEDIAGSHLITYPGVGHLPMEEKPVESARSLTSFLEQLEGLANDQRSANDLASPG